MIFTTWNFVMGDSVVRYAVELGSPSYCFSSERVFKRSYPFTFEEGRDAARQYAADIFNWCAAKRDYAYADHPEPTIPWPLHWCAAMEIKRNCVREFNR